MHAYFRCPGSSRWSSLNRLSVLRFICVSVCVVVVVSLPYCLDLSVSSCAVSMQYGTVSNKQQLVTKVTLTSLSPAEKWGKSDQIFQAITMWLLRCFFCHGFIQLLGISKCFFSMLIYRTIASVFWLVAKALLCGSKVVWSTFLCICKSFLIFFACCYTISSVFLLVSRVLLHSCYGALDGCQGVAMWFLRCYVVSNHPKRSTHLLSNTPR